MNKSIVALLLIMVCSLSINATTIFDLTKLPPIHNAIKDKKRELSAALAKFKTETSKLSDQRKKLTSDLQKQQDLKTKLENEANAIAQSLRTLTETITKQQREVEALSNTAKGMRTTALPIIISKKNDAQKAIDAYTTAVTSLTTEASDQTDRSRLSAATQPIERDAADLRKEIIAAGQFETDTIAP